MVNYLYDLANIERNHEAFAEKGQVVASPAVQKQLKTGPVRALRNRAPRRKLEQRNISMSDNLFKIVRERAPTTTFIETPDGRKITSADAIERSGRIANALVKRGVVPGDRVAVQVEKSADAIMLYLACLRAGAVYLPLNIGYTLAELEYFIGDAEPRVVVCAPEKHAALAPVAQKLGVAAVETLGTNQDGTLLDLANAQSSDFADVPRAGRRSRRDSLHLGHHRPLERRDADARQPGLQRARAARRRGASPRRTCCCTRCRFSTRTACSWRRTWSCCRARR